MKEERDIIPRAVDTTVLLASWAEARLGGRGGGRATSGNGQGLELSYLLRSYSLPPSLFTQPWSLPFALDQHPLPEKHQGVVGLAKTTPFRDDVSAKLRSTPPSAACGVDGFSVGHSAGGQTFKIHVTMFGNHHLLEIALICFTDPASTLSVDSREKMGHRTCSRNTRRRMTLRDGLLRYM